MGSRETDRDLERLIPIGGIGSPVDVNEIGSKSSSPSESRLLPIPAKRHLAKSFAAGPPKSLCPDGLGFVTSITFIFLIGVFMSSWLGASVLGLGEWFIKKMPLMSYIYTASKQISAAISPDQNSQAFKEVAIVRHPRVGEYALGFITSTVILQKSSGSEELCCVYIPTNHLYLGVIFLINSKDVMRPNLSVREGIEIVISGGMSVPKILTIVDAQSILSPRVGKYAVP